jgi:hypothetical protein
MFFVDPESPNFSDWRNSYAIHPQRELIKYLIERSVQDIFLNSLRNNREEIVYIFTNEDQIDEFIDRMVKYWEDLEDYEKCIEIKSLKQHLKDLLKKVPIVADEQLKNIKEWLKYSF